ncbi:alpha/beta fold hydrolase [Myroides injenensis]|uniref:alpha/beta fold hydrolase n=1 Tax=Myroides injenensis TaxID=1183151 RepID=UPI000287D966|nr:alpha/beta fold hydrolase [Myroides injenensis]
MSNLKEITITDYSLSTQNIQDITLSYQVFGQPLHSAPIVLVNHALTGNSEVSGNKGWWKSLVGHDQVIDLNRYTVIAFDIPGNGYNQQVENLIDDYKQYTTKIIADLFWRALDAISVHKLFAVVGGSLGGGIAWEMAFLRPHDIEHLIPIATSIKASDWVIGNVLIQENILNNSTQPIQDARMHAMLLYRTPASFQLKFNNHFLEDENKYSVESWLQYHGTALSNRFKLSSYKLMNHLLRTIGNYITEKDIVLFAQTSSVKIHSIAVDSDYMFTKEEQEKTFKTIQQFKEDISFHQIQSVHGHDAFLIEYEQLNNLLKNIF